MKRNYDTKLSGEIMTRNYVLVYYVAQNVGIIMDINMISFDLVGNHQEKG